MPIPARGAWMSGTALAIEGGVYVVRSSPFSGIDEMRDASGRRPPLSILVGLGLGSFGLWADLWAPKHRLVRTVFWCLMGWSLGSSVDSQLP
jgi:hypothetical protein